MKVGFADWQVVDTSLHLRKKKNGSSKVQKQPLVSRWCYSANDASSRIKKQSKGTAAAVQQKNAHGTDTLVLTTSHKITVMQTIVKSNGVDENEDAESSAVKTLEEVTDLQVSSRPNQSSAFISDGYPHIPAVFAHNFVIATQGGNSKLVAFQNGSQSSNISLKSAALCMNMVEAANLQSPVVYGTLVDGDLYFATLDSNNEWRVAYSSSNDSKHDDLDHLYTITRSADTSTQLSGRKRKATATTTTSFVTYQVYSRKSIQQSLVIRKTKVDIDTKSTVSFASSTISSIIAIPNHDAEVIETIKAVDAHNNSGSLILLLHFTTKTNTKLQHTTRQHTTRQHYYSIINLKQASFQRPLLLLPNDTTQIACCIINNTTLYLVVLRSTGHTDLIDVQHGALVTRHAVDASFGDSSLLSLVQGYSHGSITVVRVVNDTVKTATMQMVMEELNEPRQAMSLVDSLTSILTGNVDTFTDNVPLHNVFTIGTKEGQDCTSRIEEALEKYQIACNHVLKNPNQAATTRSLDQIELDCRSGLLLNSTVVRRNGICDDEEKKSETISTIPFKSNGNKFMHSFSNGVSPKAVDEVPEKQNIVDAVVMHNTADPDLATEYVHGIFQITMLALVNSGYEFKARRDFRIVLNRMLATNKITCRNLFGSDSRFGSLSHVAKGLETQPIQKSVEYSSVDFLLDVLFHCSDIGERQVVQILHYFLARASNQDIIHGLEKSKIEERTDKLRSTNLFHTTSTEETVLRDDTDGSDGMTVILQGTRKVLEFILLYTEFNESLLRSSLKETMSKDERLVLLRLVLIYFRQNTDVRLQRRAIQWTYALYDDCIDRTEGFCSKTTDLLLHFSRIESKRAANILKLQEDLSRLESIIRKDSAKSKKQLPPYQIERLIF